MEYRKGKILYDGPSVKVYATNNPDHSIILFKNVIAVGASKKKTVKNAGQHITSITKKLFKFLEGYHIHTYFEKTMKPDEILVKNLEMIPIQLIIWNYASGSLSKRYKIREGERLSAPVIEYYLNDGKARDVMINMDHICAFELAGQEDIETIDRVSRKANAILKSYFERRNIKLAHFALEFGRYHDKILIGNVISPLNCVLWDMQEDKLDMDRYRIDKGDPSAIFQELEKRITT